MVDSYYKSVNPVNQFTSNDGLILDVNTGDLGDADTSLTYFLLGAANYNCFSMHHVITATTLTYEATNDDFSYGNNANELITAANDRNFSSTNNWQADGTGASIGVGGGNMTVTVGNANTGAKLDKAYFEDSVSLINGFERERRYTITFSLSSLSTGSVHVYCGSQQIARALTAGASQTINFQAGVAGDKLSFVGNTASMTFVVDDVSITRQAAVWRDITNTLTDGAASSFTSTGSLTVSNVIPWYRMRVRRVTTSATNALELRLTRMKI